MDRTNDQILGTLLARIADELSVGVDLDELLDRVVDAARAVTGATFAALGVLDSEGQSIDRFVHQGMDFETVRTIGPHPTGGGLLGELIRHPEPLLLEDLTAHRSHEGFPEGHPPMRSFVGVPVQAGGRIFGNLYLTEKAGGFTEDDLRSVRILAAQAGVAVHAAQLAQQLRATAVRAERDRISRDLHDGVIQSLFSAGMGLEGAKGLIGEDATELRDRIDGVVEQLDDTIREIRSTIFTLRPDAADLGLRGGLVELAREYEVNAILRPTLNLAHGLDEAVPEEVVPDVLHVVRESLSNVAKHAGADRVMLHAEIVEGQLVVQIRDTGVGFDTDGIGQGHGLENIAERAVLLDAGLSVRSSIGEGTTVKLSVPLRLDTEEDTTDG